MVEVFEYGNLLVVRFQVSGNIANANMICNVLAKQDHPGIHEGSLHQFHVHPGPQSYAAIEELASKPESGIKLTDHEKLHSIACAEDKQTKNNQSKHDSGIND